MDDMIKLVQRTYIINKYGSKVPSDAEKTVRAELMSIGQSEFYQAQANGFKPELKFKISDFLDYDDEQIVKYTPFMSEKEKEYTVLKTYRIPGTDELEITVYGGVNDVGTTVSS